MPWLLVLVALLTACGGRKRSPEALFEQARLEMRHGNFERALAQADQALALWPDNGSSWHWRFRLLKAETLLQLRRQEQAWALLDAKVPDGPEHRELLARQRMHQGYAKYWFAQYGESKRLLDEALALALPVNSRSLLAQIELRRGTTLARLGEHAAAEASHRSALAHATAAGDLYLQAAALGSLGLRRRATSRHDEAITYLEQALAAANKIGARKFVLATLGNLGLWYFWLGDQEKALKLWTQAEAMAAQLGSPTEQQASLGNLANVYHSRQDYQTAMQYYRRALELARKLNNQDSTARWLYSLAATSIEAGDLNSAELFNQEALAIRKRIQDPRYQVWPLLNSARIARGRQRYGEAEKIYREILGLPAGQVEVAAVWEAHSGLAGLYAAQKQWPKAEKEFQSATHEIETIRSRLSRDEWKLSFLSDLIRFYQDHVEFLMDRGQVERALEVAASCRARLLADKLGLKHERLAGSSAHRFQDRARVLDAAIFSYWLAPRRSFLWVITAERIAWFELPAKRVIEALVDAYEIAVQGLRDPLETQNRAGRALFAALVAPAAHLAAPGARVIVVPDGPLHELNFESLPVLTGRPRFWIEDVTVATAPSAEVLPARPLRVLPRSSLLVIGNSVPPSPEFAPLPDVDQEIKALRGRFAAAVVLTGPQAHPAAYREASPGRFSLIHFSAHATANRESPLDSAVILSRKGDSYKLYARDVMGVPLEADVVTISACRSAGARYYSGEGLVGFAWAFLEAGARNVIAGLWDVADRSTARLMAQLYDGLRRGSGPAEALRAAKLALIRSGGPYRKPYYWAPFQVFTRADPFAAQP